MGFDAEVWLAQHDSEALERVNPRSDMVSTLLRKHLKPGAGRAEVHRLLGPPEIEEGETDYYELGRSPLGVSYERLAVEYAEGSLVRAYLART